MSFHIVILSFVPLVESTSNMRDAVLDMTQSIHPMEEYQLILSSSSRTRRLTIIGAEVE